MSKEIEDLRQPWESNEHWELRKEFLVQYQDNFDEDRLLCLAQVYANIELMSCSYPPDVMREVRHLAKDLEGSNKLQQARQERSKVQFVKAQNSTKRKRDQDHKMEGVKIQKCETMQAPVENTNISVSTLKKIAMISYNNPAWATSPTNALCSTCDKMKLRHSFVIKESEQSNQTEPQYHCKLTIEDVFIADATFNNRKGARKESSRKAVSLMSQPRLSIVQDDQGCWMIQKNSKVETSLPPPKAASHVQKKTPTTTTSFSNNFVILDHSGVNNYQSPISLFCNSVRFNRMTFKFVFSDPVLVPKLGQQFNCELFLGTNKISHGTAYTEQDSKSAAAKFALEKLRKTCYTIKVKKRSIDYATSFSREDAKELFPNNKPIPESNIGFKMMKNMGWSGGCIGKSATDGLLEPITASNGKLTGRTGFGFSSNTTNKQFCSAMKKVILEYSRSDTFENLVFGNEFTKEERKTLHSIALRYNLNHTSHGKGDDRRLVISKRYTPLKLVTIIKKAGGSTENYELLPPLEEQNNEKTQTVQ